MREYGILGVIDPFGGGIQNEMQLDFAKAEKAYSLGDYRTASHYYRRSAEAGYAPAQNNLGYAYEHGEGVQVDKVEARYWYERAASQNFCDAQRNLGFHYIESNQYEKAFDNFMLAAKQGDVTAKINVGIMYVGADGVKFNLEEGIRWLKSACIDGSEDAATILQDIKSHYGI